MKTYAVKLPSKINKSDLASDYVKLIESLEYIGQKTKIDEFYFTEMAIADLLEITDFYAKALIENAIAFGYLEAIENPIDTTKQARKLQRLVCTFVKRRQLRFSNK